MAVEYDDFNEDLVNEPLSPKGIAGFDEYDDFDDGDDLGNISFRGETVLGDVGIGDSKHDQYITEDSVKNLDVQRAELQSGFDQVGNFLTQAVVGEIVGGTIEGVGYLLDIGSVIDVMKGNEAEWGNFITEFGQSIREGTEEDFRIHQDPNAQGFEKMMDSGWWLSNGVSVASSLSMLIPATGAIKAASFLGKVTGASRGLQAARKAAGLAKEMGQKGKWMTEGLSQAIVSRNIENWMEAHGTFEDQKNSLLEKVNPETGVLFTEDEATAAASQAAAMNYKQGWAMLLQDIPQYLAIGKIFNPITKKFENALDITKAKGLKPGFKDKAKGVAGTFFEEGFEESFQFYISERSKLLSDLNVGLITQQEYDRKISEAIGSEEMMTSAFFGGLGGNLFQGAGKLLNKAFESKDRKEYRDSLGKFYDGMIQNNSKQVALMYQHLAHADEQGMADAREQIINEMMLNLTGQALEAERFDQFVETLDMISNMSEEDRASFKEESGQEFMPELAKKYAPEIRKTAFEMRDRYLKYRDKYDAKTSGKLSRIDIENTMLNKSIEKSIKNTKELVDSIDGYNSTALFERRDLQEDLDALEHRKEALKDRIEKETSPYKKEILEKVLEVNKESVNEALDALDRFRKSGKKDNIPKSKKAIMNSSYKALKDDIALNKRKASQAEEMLYENLLTKELLTSEKGQKIIESESIRREVSSLETEQDFENLQEKINNNEFISEKEKEEVLKQANEKLVEIKDKKNKEEQAAKAAAAEAERIRKANEKNDDVQAVDNQTATPISENFEDVNAHEAVDTNEAVLKKSDETDKFNEDSTRSVPVLDRVSGTQGYQKWVENTESKIDVEFKYELRPDRIFKNNSKAFDIVRMFQEAEPGKIPQAVYDSLPITAQHKTKPNVFSYLPQKPSPNASAIEHERYKNNYEAQRKIIIDRLKAGEDTTTQIVHTTGGELVVDPNENGLAPENSFLDLQQINSADDVDIVFSNDEGVLMTPLKQLDQDLVGTRLDVGKDSDGNYMPYRGGVFVKVKKADGTIFPIRANLAKNTKEQAIVLSQILMDVAVPAYNEETGKKEAKSLKLDSYLSDVNPELKVKIEATMGPEIKVLGKDPKISDIISMFVYVSEEGTKGKTSELYMSGEHLFYASKDQDGKHISKRITPKNRTMTNEVNSLIDFLTNVKRRQISINLMSRFPEYKKFILENKIISTNGTTKGPLFQNKSMEGKRRIKNYLAPLAPPVEEVKSDGSPEMQNIIARREKSIKTGVVEKTVDLGNGNVGTRQVAVYWDPKKAWKSTDYGTLEEVLALYDAEIAALKKSSTQGVSNNAGTKKTLEDLSDKLRKANEEAEKAKKKAKEKKPTIIKSDKPKSPVSDKVWDKFVDTGKASTYMVNKITKKIIAGETLDEREQAIRTAYSKNVEDKLNSAKKSEVKSNRDFQNKVYVKAYDELRNSSKEELQEVLDNSLKVAKLGGRTTPIGVAKSFIARKILDGKIKELDNEYGKSEETVAKSEKKRKRVRVKKPSAFGTKDFNNNNEGDINAC